MRTVALPSRNLKKNATRKKICQKPRAHVCGSTNTQASSAYCPPVHPAVASRNPGRKQCPFWERPRWPIAAREWGADRRVGDALLAYMWVWAGSRVAVRPKKGGGKLAKSQPRGEAWPGAGLEWGRGLGGAAGPPSDRWSAKRHTRLVEENGAQPVGDWAYIAPRPKAGR